VEHHVLMHELAFRAAAPADAEDLARAVVVGVEIEHVHALLGDEHVWCLLAEADGELVGQA